ncbi:MAG TPA: prepilin-type N-terminal cleavage/methylation domain-containing protein [Gemmatimonadaceae bacterium]
MRSDAGLSLVELLVALALLSVGALALAGNSAAAVRAAREGRVARDEAADARDHLERSAAAACIGATSGDVRLVESPIPKGRFAGARLFAVRTC